MTSGELIALIDDPEARRRVGARELASAFLERIAQRTPAIHAVVTPTPEVAMADADRVEVARRAGTPLPLDGMPVVLKDNIDVEGVPSHSGSRVLAGTIAPRDAFVTALLRKAGAIVLGKAQTTEVMFALASHPDFPSCVNPWDPDRIPGASSSGSGAAVGDDEAVGALGTDTGGSVRIPASLSGVTGLRPTHGVLGCTGVFPLARSLDAVGPMARSADDVAQLFEVLAQLDPQDTRAVRHTPPPADEPGAQLTIGIPKQFWFDDCHPDIEREVLTAIEVLRSLGHRTVEVDLPLAYAAHEGFTYLVRAEALAVHAERLADRPDDFTVDVRDRLRLGEQLTGRDLALIAEDRAAWIHQLRGVFETVDAIATPTVQCLPPLLEDARLGKLPDVTRLTYPWSFGLLPAISAPCGLTGEGLPAGLQLAAAPHRERRLLDLVRAYQSVTDWHRRRPPTDR